MTLICYGYKVDNPPWDRDIESWYRKIKGFTPTKEIYNDDGTPCLGCDEDDVEIYFAELMEFDELHPIPVTLVYTGYFVIACPSTVSHVLGELALIPDEQIALDAFAKEFDLKVSDKGWHMVRT